MREVFGKELASVDAIVNNAGGCGPVMKEYGHLLDNTASAAAGALLCRQGA